MKSEMRGDTGECHALKKENAQIQRELASLRDELASSSARYEMFASKIQEVKATVVEYEGRLRYGNEVIQGLETENRQIELDVAGTRSHLESQNRAYNELKNNFYLVNNGVGGISGASSSPVISIPKVVMPSAYYKPNPSISH